MLISSYSIKEYIYSIRNYLSKLIFINFNVKKMHTHNKTISLASQQQKDNF